MISCSVHFYLIENPPVRNPSSHNLPPHRPHNPLSHRPALNPPTTPHNSSAHNPSPYNRPPSNLDAQQQAARQHLLFPLLDALNKSVQQTNQRMSKIECSLNETKDEIKIVNKSVIELKQLFEKYQKTSFSLKDKGYEV